MTEGEALAWAVHNLSLTELKRLTGVSVSTWQRCRRTLPCPSQTLVKPQSNPSQTLVSDEPKPEIAPSSLNIPSPSEKGAMAPNDQTRDEKFQLWKDNPHPMHVNVCRKYGIDLESLLNQFQSFVLGTAKGAEVVNFHQRFYGFIEGEKAKLASQKSKDASYQKSQEQWQEERRQRFAQAPGEVEHERERKERATNQQAETARLRALNPGFGSIA